MKDKVQGDFGVLRQKCSEKLTDLCKKEKQIWKTLDDLEADSEELMKLVDEKTTELVSKEQYFQSIKNIFEHEFPLLDRSLSTEVVLRVYSNNVLGHVL